MHHPKRTNQEIRCSLNGRIQPAHIENFPLFNDRHDLAKLKGHRDYNRLRTGDMRTIFKIDKQEKRIYVEKMERRESAYEK